MQASCVHGRSGNVTLLRVKMVLARAALFVVDVVVLRRAVRSALLLRSVLDISFLTTSKLVKRLKRVDSESDFYDPSSTAESCPNVRASNAPVIR